MFLIAKMRCGGSVERRGGVLNQILHFFLQEKEGRKDSLLSSNFPYRFTVRLVKVKPTPSSQLEDFFPKRKACLLEVGERGKAGDFVD